MSEEACAVLIVVWLIVGFGVGLIAGIKSEQERIRRQAEEGDRE